MRARLVAMMALAACGGGGSGGPVDGHGAGSDAPCGGCDAPHMFPATLDGDRDRLLETYLAYLKANPTVTQSNGLSGANLQDTCQLWTMLAPSAQQVFLTITHRLYGSVMYGGQHALDHVTKLYRLVGGQDATASSPGSCGGGEYNRMIMSMDAELHTAQLAANTNQGAAPYDIADVIANGYWRDSHDLGGTHAPFDTSDETNDGAPRGQTQYFKDPAGTLATTALGRMDLTTLVDPYALEMDQDYDCVHNSNPACSYTTYGPLCAPEANLAGTQIYTQKYGDFGPAWKPTGC